MLDASSSQVTSKPAIIGKKPGSTLGKASLAVLPFANMSGEQEQDYFADGIAEDILTELSRFRNLFVIARNSSFSFKGKGLSVQDIARELNVEYIVSGSVRRAGNRVRVAAQLANAVTGQEIWADRYDRELEDIFKVQDEVVRTIVITMESTLGMAMANNAKSIDTPSLAAYECLLLAKKYIYLHDAAQAMPYVERALELDPSYALAHVNLATAYFIEYLENMGVDTLEKVHSASKKAVALDESDSRGHAILGMSLICKKQYELAHYHLERAMRLNPADAHALAFNAEWLLRTGDAEKALITMEQLFLRDPIPHPGFWEVQAIALFILGRYEEAIAAMSRIPKMFWYIHGILAICHAKLGRAKEAKADIDKLLLLKPSITMTQYILLEEYQSQKYLDIIAEGLRFAGLPE